MCFDYHSLNRQMKLDTFPIPCVAYLLDRLGKATVFSFIDGSYAYHQVHIREGDKQKSAFLTPYGLFEYLAIPIGLCNALATFQHLLSLTFFDLMCCMTSYLDDILVFGPTVEQHMLDLRDVFECLHKKRLFAKNKKCFFGYTFAKYLQHIVKAGSIHADPDKVEAIRTWPKPTTVKELQQFLGLKNYYA